MNDIIEQFNQNDNLFAKDAILEARKYKGKINDLLLQEVENYSNDLAKQPDTYPPFSVIYSIYLLAEFKDKRLFPTLIRLFSQENDEILDILGDWVLDDLAPILVSVFPNDYESLNSIIENVKINKYIRAEFLSCYSYFYFTGMISQDELEKYLRHLIELCKTSNDDDYIFAAIADFIADIHLFSMLKDVEELYKENRVELSYQPPCTESTGFAWMTESHTMLKHTVLHKNIITNFFLICYIFLDNILCYGSYASTKISSRPHMLPPILSS